LPPNPMRCPHCDSAKSWKIRRSSRKCKACRREWRPGGSPRMVAGFAWGEAAWREFVRCFLRYRTIGAVRLHAGGSAKTVMLASRAVRAAMLADMPPTLSGIVESDETFITGKWSNKRWETRRLGTRRGKGTQKQAVFGLFERGRGVVLAFLVPDVKGRTLRPIVLRHVERGSAVYSDGYQFYQTLPRDGYAHEFVDHNRNEYARGAVTSNGIEGFWGILKRRLAVKGGVQRRYLHLFVAEECWRYNHRNAGEGEAVDLAIAALKEFGGKTY